MLVIRLLEVCVETGFMSTRTQSMLFDNYVTKKDRKLILQSLEFSNIITHDELMGYIPHQHSDEESDCYIAKLINRIREKPLCNLRPDNAVEILRFFAEVTLITKNKEEFKRITDQMIEFQEMEKFTSDIPVFK